ncbi:MAG TPA: sigma-54 dependent transcriptional regulator [Kofleriaceae bacterium]|nr:sigma-54 dependent transcriptional regulator [Kofleriaceae bacterium]
MVVEADLEVAGAIARKLGGDGHEVEVSRDPRPVVARLEANDRADWDVVLLDAGPPGLATLTGLDVLRRFREAGSPASIVMLTGDNTATTAAACMAAGAFYYLAKPVSDHELASLVEAAARCSALRRELAGVRRRIDDAADPLLVGTSPAMRKLHAALDRLAGQDVSILIRGERGTGKQLVARALHERGTRRNHRFVALDCGAIPEALIDSELFGHTQGAFTGATTDRAGVFVEADGGTLLLDEIGDLPTSVQARLLRVLQEAEVRPVGGSGVRTVDVRVIAASHVDLTAAVEHGRFRQDLFYRLNVVVLSVPALRDRLEDLPILAAHFLRKHGGIVPGGGGGPMTSVSPAALDAMLRYAWPGNVRELENAILHAIALRQGDAITPESLPAVVLGRGGLGRAPATIPVPAVGAAGGQLPPLTEAKRRAAAMFEKSYLVMAMERAKGSISEAARLAGLDRTNFRRLLQRQGIDATTFKA